MPELVITPNPTDLETPGDLVIGDGNREVSLLGTPPNGLYLVELRAPLPDFDNTMARGVDSQGAQRVRTLGQNSNGTVLMRIDHSPSTEAAFLADVNDLEDIVASAHRLKGYIRFQWPNGREVTYRLQSCKIVDVPLTSGHRITKRIAEFQIDFECEPFGELAAVTVFEDEAFNDSVISSYEITDVPGHENAFGRLTVVDTSGEASDHFEVGVIRDGYDPTATLLIEEDDLVISGFAGTQPGGPGTVILADLSPSPIAVCGTGTQSHGGDWAVRCRLAGRFGLDGVWIRFAWRVDGGRLSYGPWVEAPVGEEVYAPQIAVISLGNATEWDGQVEAYAESGDETIKIRHLRFMPAAVHGVVRQPPNPAAGTSYQALAAFTGNTTGNLSGQSASTGGSWTAAALFQVEATPELDWPTTHVKVASAGSASPGLARLSPTIGPLDAAIRVGVDWDPALIGTDDELSAGVLVRYVDSTNWAALAINILGEDPQNPDGGLVGYLKMLINEAGDLTERKVQGSAFAVKRAQRPLRLTIDADGVWHAYFNDLHQMGGQSSALAVGGALATGKVGLYSLDTLGGNTSFFDQLRVLAQPEDHVIWPNQAMRIREGDAKRQGEDGTIFGRALLDGDYLTIPPSTGASLPVLLAMARRSYDIDSGLPDDGYTDNMTATLTIVPRVTLL